MVAPMNRQRWISPGRIWIFGVAKPLTSAFGG